MIAIIKYNAGNIRSVQNALNRLECPSVITDDPDEIRRADKVILPGVGEASTAMKYLRERELDKLLVSLKQPLLGICLGLQLMCDYSEEGNTDCLGIFKTTVKKFPDKDIVPHMGWNNLTKLKSKLFEGLTSNDDVYFVHSYYAELCESTIGECDYILPLSASLNRENFYATQFHPEKSAWIGEKILKNFLAL
jgi:glutamine amidotransferase